MLRRVAGVSALLLLPSLSVAQTENWIGLVQEIEGKWDLLDATGRKTGELKPYLPVPVDAVVKIAEQKGPASGRLKIALKDGTTFQRCCTRACQTRDTDCGEAVPIKISDNRAKWGDVLERLGALLSRGPDRFPVPVIGGRTPYGAELQLADGVVVVTNSLLRAAAMVRRTPDKAEHTPYWLEVVAIQEGLPVGVIGRTHIDAIGSGDPIRVTSGLYQISVLTDPEAEPTGLNSWLLAVPSPSDPRIAEYQSVVEACGSLDRDVAGALRRAYLSSVAIAGQ